MYCTEKFKAAILRYWDISPKCVWNECKIGKRITRVQFWRRIWIYFEKLSKLRKKFRFKTDMMCHSMFWNKFKSAFKVELESYFDYWFLIFENFSSLHINGASVFWKLPSDNLPERLTDPIFIVSLQVSFLFSFYMFVVILLGFYKLPNHSKNSRHLPEIHPGWTPLLMTSLDLKSDKTNFAVGRFFSS